MKNFCAKKAKKSAFQIGFFLLVPALLFRLNAQDIHIRPSGLKVKGGGTVWICLFNAADGFPDEPSQALRAEKFKPGELFILKSVSPGPYAVSLLHDLDGDGKMTYSFFGIPKDGFSSSPDGGPLLSKPTFSKAVFLHRGGVSKLEMKIHYLP